MRNEYVKLAKFLLVGVLIMILADACFGGILRYLERTMRGGERARTYYSVNRAKADVFIFGSSRALYHYNPSVMGEVMNMSVYNAGRSAQTVLYHLPVLRMILKRHTPKLVILDINENEFAKDQQKYDIVNFLLPYYRADSSVRSIVDDVKPYYKYFSWSKTLPYNSSAISMFWRTVRPLHGEEETGYAPVYGHRVRGDSVVDNCRQTYDPDPRIERAFAEFILTCKRNKIPVMVVVSPRASRFICPRKDLEHVRNEVIRLGVHFVDYSSNLKYLKHPEWMHDPSHLNYEGSIEYSREVGSYLKSICHNGLCNL